MHLPCKKLLHLARKTAFYSRIFVLILVLLFTLTPPLNIQAALTDAPTSWSNFIWQNYLYNGLPVYDQETSADVSRGSAAVQPDSIDISSGAASGDDGPGNQSSVLFAYYDGGTPGDASYLNDHYGFRVRLGDDPQHGPSGGYVSYHWNVLLDIDGDNWKEFVIDLSGDYSGSKPDRLYVFYNDDNTQTYDPVNDYITDFYAAGGTATGDPQTYNHTRVLAAPGGLDITQKWLDFQIPITALKNKAGVQQVMPSSPVRLFYSTAASNVNPLQKDWMLSPFSFGDPLTPDIQVTKIYSLFNDADNNTVPSPGDVLRYVIEIKNEGNTVAEGVVFSDTPDANTALVTGSVEVYGAVGYTVTSGNSAGDTVVGVNLGEIAAGAAVQIIFQVTIGYDGFDSVANQGRVSGTNFVTVLSDDPGTVAENDPTVTPVTIGDPALTISKEGPGQAMVGSVISYSGVISNNSQGTAYNAVLVDQLPVGVTFVSSSHNAVYDPVLNRVSWELGDIGHGVTIPGWLSVRIYDNVTDGTVLTDRFSLIWEDSEGNLLGPAVAECNTTVYTQGRLALSKEGPVEAIPSQIYSYTLSLINEGGSAAEGTVLTDTLPDEVSYVSSNPVGIYSAGPPETVSWNLGTIEAYGTKTVIVTVQVDAGGIGNGTVISNNASVSWTGYGPVTDSWETTIYSEPQVTITKEGPVQAGVDTNITYTGTLSNVGGSTAYNVILLDQLPAGVTFVSSSHSAVYDPGSNTVTWNLGNVGAGVSIPGWLTVHIAEDTPNETVLTNSFNAVWDDSLGNEHGPSMAYWDTTVYTSPLLTVEKVGPEMAHVGDSVQYTLTVSNIGGTDALNTLLVDALPGGLSYSSSNPVGTEAGGFISWNLGTIPAYGSVSVIVNVTVDSGVLNRTELVNTVRVMWEDTIGRSFGPETAVEEITIYTLPQLAIEKSGPVVSYPDNTYSYNITVCNIGGAAAENVTLKDYLPDNLTYNSSNYGGTYDAGSRTVSWSLGAINSDVCITDITVSVTVDSVVGDGTLLENVIEGRWEDGGGQSYGPVGANWETEINHLPQLSIMKTGPVEARQGDNLTYEIKIENIGGSRADNVTLYDDLPVGLTYTGSAPVGTPVGGGVSWNLGSLESGDNLTVQISVSVDYTLPPRTQVTDTAMASWQALSQTYGPVTASANTLVDSALEVTKTADKGVVFAGDEITYTLTYQNLGTHELSGVVVTEDYDTNVAFVTASPLPDVGSDNKTWTIGTLGAGASGTITVVVQANPDIGGNIIIRNQVRIMSEQGATDDFQVHTEEEMTYSIEADKTASLVNDADGSGTISAGDTLEYTIIITNTGNAKVTGVVFTDTPDTHTELVAGSIYTSQGTIDGGNDGVPPVRVTAGTIPIGGSVEIRFQVTIKKLLRLSIISNQGSVESGELPVVLTNDPGTAQSGDPTITRVRHRVQAVGGEVKPIDRGDIIYPWIGLALVATAGGTMLFLKRRYSFRPGRGKR